jgi:arginyl-tRNA synthetase
LRDKIVEKVLSEMKNEKIKNREEIAKAIGIGAMKYDMLKIGPEKVIFFDWEDALKLEGNTAPYLQYAHTRCSGILGKSKKWKVMYTANELTDYEKRLVKILSRFPRVIEEASNDFRPNYICNYVYELATTFNNFYENCPVIKAERGLKNFRLTLVQATEIVLKNCLRLIGIKAIEKM